MPSPETQAAANLRPVQLTAVHAAVTDPSGRLLLTRAGDRSHLRGRWFLPGVPLRHGEHPRDGVLRGLAEETGLRATIATVRHATAEVIDYPYRGVSVHTLRLLYDVRLPAGSPSVGPALDVSASELPAVQAVQTVTAGGNSDLARFVTVEEAASLPLMPFVADLLGLPAGVLPDPAPPVRPRPFGVVGEPEPEPDDVPVPVLDVAPGEQPIRVQRPAAYAVLIDDPGAASDLIGGSGLTGGPDLTGKARMLLTRLSNHKDTWTLPGGGIDHGELPLVALTRELFEETGLPYTPGPLIDIGSRHFVGRAPDGRLEDFQGLRLVYAGSVPGDLPPTVTEVDGSTDLAAWIPVADLRRSGVVPAVRESFAIWSDRRRAAADPATHPATDVVAGSATDSVTGPAPDPVTDSASDRTG